MKIEPVSSNTVAGGTYGYALFCPGCSDYHVLKTEGPSGWKFDGNMGSPTFAPSLLCYEYKDPDSGAVIIPRCHSFIRNGQWEFLADSGHALAGKTVPLVEFPEAVRQ